MIEREMLLQGATTVLVLWLAWQFPTLASRWSRRDFGLLIAGSLLPLGDLLLNLLLADDRIDALGRLPLLSSPLMGLSVLAAGAMVTAFVVPVRQVLRGVGLIAVGYGIAMVLALFTPMGIMPASPFLEVRWVLPVFPIGHPPLLLILVLATGVMAIWKGSSRWVRPVGLGFVVVYALLGFGQFGVIAHQVGSLGIPGQKVHIYPDGSWLWRWVVVVESPNEYQIRRHHVLRKEFAEPHYFERWNNQALFLKLLADPVVHSYYFHVFRHPVVQLDTTGSQITLLLQELEHQWPLVPGPTFYLESDLNGRNRLYQLQRFH